MEAHPCPLKCSLIPRWVSRLNCSPQAARALAKRLRLPRQRANDGKALVAVDLAELTHKPMRARSPAGDHPITATLKGRVKTLQEELVKIEALASGRSASAPSGSWGRCYG